MTTLSYSGQSGDDAIMVKIGGFRSLLCRVDDAALREQIVERFNAYPAMQDFLVEVANDTDDRASYGLKTKAQDILATIYKESIVQSRP